jgi:hypothetical protein
MSNTADRLRELADTVEHVEDEQGIPVRDIDVRFVRPSTGAISQMISVLSGVQAEPVPVFDLELGPRETEDVEDEPDDQDDDGDETEDVEIDLEDPTEDGVDEDETAEAADGGGA